MSKMTTPPDELVQTLRSLEAEWTRASRSLVAVMPKEMAGAFNLMAHPAALASASTIVGMGAASHAAGLWIGAWIGAAENMQRIMTAPFGARAEQASQEAARRTRAAMDTLIADAKSVADEIAKPSGRSAASDEPAKRERASKPARETVMERQAPEMPVAMPKPDKPDDLKAITGVGPKLEQVLNGLGIWTYDQITALTPAEIDWIEDYLSFKGRITRDDWLGQAAKLAAGGKGSG
jgi:NADH-quinone oxidoreductase subunit E